MMEVKARAAKIAEIRAIVMVATWMATRMATKVVGREATMEQQRC
jgi:hypothetical protein